MIEKKRIQIRRDLEQNWVETNPILLYGEIGFDLTNNKIKIGDGERPWNELSWVNEIDIDLSIFYTKEEIDTILNELNTNLSNDYYTKEQVDEIVSNIEIGGGGSVGTTNYNELENRPTTNIQGLTYDEIINIYNYYNENGNLPYSLVYQSYNLNNARISVVNVDTTIIMTFTIDGLVHKDIRLWIWTNTNDYGFDIIEYTPNNVYDLRLIEYSKALEIFNYIWENNEFPSNTTLVIDGVMLNKLERTLDWWDESDGTKYFEFKYYGKPKSYIIRVITWESNGSIYHDFLDVDENETLTTVSKVNELIANSGGGGSVGTTNYNELENRPTTNIQGLTYEQVYELMEHINIHRELPYPLSFQGIYLNDCRLGTVEPNFIEINIDGLNSIQVRLWLNTEEQSFSIDTLDYMASTDVFDIKLMPLQKRDWFFDYLKTNLSLPENCTVVVGGIILNGLEIFNPYEDNESIEIYFRYYGHPKSYNIRLLYFKENKFISYDLWEIENNELVTKNQVDELIANSGGGSDVDLSNYYTKEETKTEIQNAIDSIEIPEQQEVSNATITIVQGDNNQSFNLNQSENQTIMLENKNFNWFGNETNFESLPDEQKVNGIYYISDKINYKDDITGQPYIVYKTSQLLNDKPFATTNDIPKEWFGTQEEFDLLENYETNTTYYIETNGGGESVDLSDYYTKEQTNTEIQNAINDIEFPTTDLSNYYTKQEIDNIVGLINNELEIIING